LKQAGQLNSDRSRPKAKPSRKRMLIICNQETGSVIKEEKKQVKKKKGYCILHYVQVKKNKTVTIEYLFFR
jgi:hypothetical protein